MSEPHGLPLHPLAGVGNQQELADLANQVAQSAAPDGLPKAPSFHSVAPHLAAAPAPQQAPGTPAAPQQVGPALPPGAGEDAIAVVEDAAPFDLQAALRYLLEAHGSDLHITAAAPPTIRVNGSMTPIAGAPVLTGAMTREAVFGILTSKQQAVFEKNNELDLAYTVPGVSRFRVNVFVQRHEVGAVFRAIPWEIKTLDTLGMPEVVNQFAYYERGLVLVTGPTGSGKSTTLASIIDEVNRNRAVHIMTVEDPIEFEHAHKRALVNQREVGDDTHTFASALKHVLRQDPDVILVGELRDLETISTALTAAETGHLVFATLHTQSAHETISRVVDVFPANQQDQVRTQLASSLQAVLCQTLLPRRGHPGRISASEIMVCDDGIRNLIRRGNIHQIPSAMQTGGTRGMQTMNKHLANLTMAGAVSYRDAWDKAPDRSEFEALTGGEAAVGRMTNASPGNQSSYGSM